jgi:UDP-glucose 4-epimerase
MKTILVTGGAGYIGSHLVCLLGESGYTPVTFDNLSTGNKEAVLYGDLVTGDLADRNSLGRAFEKYRPDAVMHLAASIRVEESVSRPLYYYHNNLSNTIQLLELMSEHGVNSFIFSSTAAVYGMPEENPVTEDTPTGAINPYGASKLMCEEVLRDLAAASGLRYVALRYFNVAGADEQCRTGQKYDHATHLITRALKAAKGELGSLEIFGTDYPTPDGTCVRDYIHVHDIARAHILALQALQSGLEGGTYNCGYGHGYSVRQIIGAVKEVTGVDFPVREAGRREGDAPSLVADSSRIRNELGWQPSHDDLEYIVKTAWEWERRL